MPFTIRRLGVGDEGLVRRLSLDSPLFDVDPSAKRKYEPLGWESATRLLADSRTHFLAVVEDGSEEVAGFLLANELLRRHGDDCMALLYEIGVRADRRRRGIGRLLLSHFTDLCRSRGIRRGFVLTEESNPEAMAFYSRCGWVSSHERDDVVFRIKFD